MGKGKDKTGKKSSHYQYKKRCCNCGDKRAKYEDEGQYYCKNCWRDI